MIYKIQVFYPEAGGYMPANHQSDDPEKLKELIASGIFAGVNIRIVDSDLNEVPLGDVASGERKELTVEDIRKILGVPVLAPTRIFRPNHDD